MPEPTTTELQIGDRPLLVAEYVGDELAIFWVSPYKPGLKEKITTFWWPTHPEDKTSEVETTFEQIAELLVTAWNCNVSKHQIVAAIKKATEEPRS